MIWVWIETHLMLCLSFSSPSPRLFLPPYLSLVTWRRSVGAERSCLVKRLPDDKKIRGISLLTGCCVRTLLLFFFFLFPPFFFCFKCFLSVSFQSSCLSSTMSAAGSGTHTYMHAKSHTHVKTHVQFFFFLVSHRRRIWFCVLRLVALGGGRGAVHSQRRLPLC